VSRGREVRRSLGVLLVLMGLALSGCVSLPREGAVRSVSAKNQGEGDALVDFTPGGPKPGSAPVPLVDNFLTSMTATPLNTFVARQFLTSGSSNAWVPERGTLVYGSHQLVSLPGGRVELQLRDVVELDDRGTWLGDRTGGKGHDYTLRLVKEDGELRIDNPPDELIIPRSYFETQFQQYFLYFFDKSAQVLVPEPVYAPRGLQAPTLLVSALLKGPLPRLAGVEGSFLPRGTRLDGISVPVARDGTAEVPLSDQVLDVDDSRLNLMFAQLAWTLGQIPGVQRMRVTVGGTPVELPGARVDVGVNQWSEFDPAVAWASTALFGTRERRVVTLVGDRESRVSGPLGSLPLALRSVGVDLPAQHVAGVAPGGTRVLESAKDQAPGQPATMSDVHVVYANGTNVLRPGYDLYGQLWLVDATPSGARLLVVRAGRARAVPAPGLTGQQVVRFVLSRDGTRLAAVVRRDGGDRLVIARVERDTVGRVRTVLPAVPLSLTGVGNPRIRDLAWRAAGGLAVLAGPTAATSQVLVVKVDGSSTPDQLSTDAELFHDQAVQLVTSPAVGAPLYIRTLAGQLFSLASTGRWTGTSIEPGLGSPTFVG
jgi:Lipoprotein LpqB beta-propeller domain/Sporulation and spore germination